MPYKDRQRQREFQRQRRSKIRAEWIANNGPCVQCGSKERLEVDHIDPKNKTSHRVWSWTSVKRLEELKKCQVLCHECHKKKTLAQRKKAIHGSSRMYNVGCRCSLCTLHNTERKRRARNKHKRPASSTV